MSKNYIVLIQEVLDKRGWTQQELASELNVTFATLSRWIHGHAIPHRSNIVQITGLHRQYVGLQVVDAHNYQQQLAKILDLKRKNILDIFKTQPQLFKDYIITSTYNSNRIEGTSLTFRETQQLIDDYKFVLNKPYADHLVTSNHAALVKNIFEGMYAGDIGANTIKIFHQRLFQGVRDDAGQYSQYQRGIAGLNIQLPHPQDVPEEMERWIKKVNDLKNKNIVEHMAKTHADFELIHPFGDGNGRVGRLILMLQCIQNNLPPLIVREENKQTYYEVLEEAQRRSHEHLALFFMEELKNADEILKKYRV